MAKEGRSINRRVVEDLDSGQRKPAAIQWEGKELSRPRNEVLHRSEATAFRRVVIVNDKVLSRPRPNDRASSATLSPRGPFADLPCRHSLPRNIPSCASSGVSRLCLNRQSNGESSPSSSSPPATATHHQYWLNEGNRSSFEV